MCEIIRGYGIDSNFNLVYDKNSKLMGKFSKRLDNRDSYYTVVICGGDMCEIIRGYGIDSNFNLVYDKNSKLMGKLNRFIGCKIRFS